MSNGTYTFQMEIHGIIGFVRDDHHQVTVQGVTKEISVYHVVVPNLLMGARGRGKRAPALRTEHLDGTYAVRHDARLYVDTHDLGLRGHRIEFFHDAGEGVRGTLGDIPKMAAIVGGTDCRMNPDLYEKPGLDVAGLLLIDRGRVEAKALDPNTAEVIIEPLAGSGRAPVEGKIPTTVVWTVTGLQGAIELKLIPFDGGQTIPIPVPAPAGQHQKRIMDARVHNHRADTDPNVSRTAAKFNAALHHDPDFRMHYKMLTKDVRDRLKTSMGSHRTTLPYPRVKDPSSSSNTSTYFGRVLGTLATLVRRRVHIDSQNCRPCEFCL